MPRIERLNRWIVAASMLVLSVKRASAQHLWTVDDDGPADFATIQGAVDAAADGDVVRVLPGTYAGFQFANKGVAIVGDSTTPRTLTSPVAVASLSAGKTVLLSGFAQPNSGAGTAPGISVISCAGSVRVQDCSWRGQHSSNFHGGSGAWVQGSSDVIFSSSSATGGKGGVANTSSFPFYTSPSGGGHGFELSASSLACWGGSAVAGLPGISNSNVNLSGGDGGHGALLSGAFLFASGTLLQGGKGGSQSLNSTQCTQSSAVGDCGDGGHGVRFLFTPSEARVQEPNILAGAGGTTTCPPWFVNGHVGKPVAIDSAGSTAVRVPSVSRKLAAAAYVAGTTLVDLTAVGLPGDLVYAVASTATHFQYDATLAGVWALPYPPQFAPNPDAVIPAGGSVVFQITLPTVPATQDAAVQFVQLYVVDSNGQKFVSTPRAIVLAH